MTKEFDELEKLDNHKIKSGAGKVIFLIITIIAIIVGVFYLIFSKQNTLTLPTLFPDPVSISFNNYENDLDLVELEEVIEPELSNISFSSKFDDITLEYYNHNTSEIWLLVKNNSKNNIEEVTIRAIYYDFSGNMIDYEDFKKHVNIDTGLVKKIFLNIPFIEYKNLNLELKSYK